MLQRTFGYSILFAVLGLTASGRSAHAHEPLWGESAGTVGDRVVHPDIRFGSPKLRLFRNRGTASNPTDFSLSRFDQTIAVDYGVGPRINYRVEVPISRLRLSEMVGDAKRRARYWEPGDLLIGAKYRFKLHVAPGAKDHESLFFGVMFPTGRTNRKDNQSNLLPPHLQPGTGTFGARVGYAWTKETTRDTWWFSVEYERFLSRSRFRSADGVEVNLTYGKWLKFPSQISDMGTILALGVHGEWEGRDHVQGVRDPDSGGSLLGLHTTFVVQRFQNQARLGVLVPFRRRVNGTQTVPRYEIRFGIERFF